MQKVTLGARKKAGQGLKVEHSAKEKCLTKNWHLDNSFCFSKRSKVCFVYGYLATVTKTQESHLWVAACTCTLHSDQFSQHVHRISLPQGVPHPKFFFFTQMLKIKTRLKQEWSSCNQDNHLQVKFTLLLFLVSCFIFTHCWFAHHFPGVYDVERGLWAPIRRTAWCAPDFSWTIPCCHLYSVHLRRRVVSWTILLKKKEKTVYRIGRLDRHMGE